MNYIISTIVGIIMFVIIGTQVTPGYLENNNINNIQNIINEQETLKEAIFRYINIEKTNPLVLNDLINYIPTNFNKNIYSFKIDSDKGLLTIYTTITNGTSYFKNNLNLSNETILCSNKALCDNRDFKTLYFLDDNTFFNANTYVSKKPSTIITTYSPRRVLWWQGWSVYGYYYNGYCVDVYGGIWPENTGSAVYCRLSHLDCPTGGVLNVNVCNVTKTIIDCPTGYAPTTGSEITKGECKRL